MYSFKKAYSTLGLSCFLLMAAIFIPLPLLDLSVAANDSEPLRDEHPQCQFRREEINRLAKKSKRTKADNQRLYNQCKMMEEYEPKCPSIPPICSTLTSDSTNTSESTNEYKWVKGKKADPCEYHDSGSSSGADPASEKCKAENVGTLAVCWDNEVIDKYHPGKIWCTYKDKNCKLGKEGKSPGNVWECKRQ